MKNIVFYVGIILAGILYCNTLYAFPPVPNVVRTPGDTCSVDDPDFREFRYGERIPYCERHVDWETKKWIYESYGIPYEEHGDYTIDHLIPLAIGGSNSVENLWPEHRVVKSWRPALEIRLYAEMRDGSLSQQDAISTVLWAKFHPDQYVEDTQIMRWQSVPTLLGIGISLPGLGRRD